MLVTEIWVCDILVVSVKDCRPRGWGFNPHQGRNLLRDFSPTQALYRPQLYEYIDRTLRWEDKASRVWTGHPPQYAEAKKIKALKLYTFGCLLGLA